MGTRPPRYWNRYIKYEVVHEVCGWNDLRRHLQSNCRCSAFFHPVMPRAPLIFVEVALVDAMAARIGP